MLVFSPLNVKRARLFKPCSLAYCSYDLILKMNVIVLIKDRTITPSSNTCAMLVALLISVLLLTISLPIRICLCTIVGSLLTSLPYCSEILINQWLICFFQALQVYCIKTYLFKMDRLNTTLKLILSSFNNSLISQDVNRLH